MGQNEVLDFLKSRPNKLFQSRDISEKLQVTDRSVSQSLKQLNKYGVISVANPERSRGKFFTYNLK